MLETFEVAVRYQMYHSLGLLAAAWAVSQWQNQLTAASGWCFFAGILIFSGSLYVLSLTGIRWLGAITPIGGLAFIVGWGCLTIAAIRGGLRRLVNRQFDGTADILKLGICESKAGG